MNNLLRFSCLSTAFLVFALAASAQLAPQAVSPHVPPAISAAKTVFISNAGADSGLFPSPFSGNQDRAYQQFYTSIQNWNHFQIVDDPAKADLVFELRLSAPKGPQNPTKQTGASDPLPMLRLVVYDRATHYVLWAFTASIENAFLQKTHDRNFDLALDELTKDFKQIAGQTHVTTP